ncbi:MAG: radical SAM family heme chaperone HemW [Crocinitomicaceae bacterium]
MAGIYIHIPFCKQACHYCDFHFSISHGQLDDMVDSILLELEQRKFYLNNEEIKTIYYGGGTPSLLQDTHINLIQKKIYDLHPVVKDVEITFECNPDDLSIEYLTVLKKRGVNRLSIGIQSFEESELQKLNRAHTAIEAEKCIQSAHNIGFKNITIDLIYGLPKSTIFYWKNQIEKALALGVKHISAYCLTFEEKTAFGTWLQKGKIKPLSDEKSLAQFKLLVAQLKNNQFEHYEISNFALDGFISRHNSAYWLGEKYLGIGPSAHSYDGKSRQWNIANNPQYIKRINEESTVSEREVLSEKDKFNEYLLTRLRTKWGIEKNFLNQLSASLSGSIEPILADQKEMGHIKETNSHFFITEKGKFLVDNITSKLFVI